MPTVEVVLVQPDHGFSATDAAGQTIRMDSSPQSGGQGAGVSPMQSLLMALGGCSGIDVMDILKKGRQTVQSFRMIISGEREKGKTPALWEQVHVTFELSGAIEPEKARRAAALSMETYCSVAETLRRAGCTITWDVQVQEATHTDRPGTPL